MGNSALIHASASQLSTEEKATITSHLKVKYEEYVSQNMDEVAIYEALSKDHEVALLPILAGRAAKMDLMSPVTTSEDKASSDDMQTSHVIAKQFFELWHSGRNDEGAHQILSAMLQKCPLAGRIIHGLPGDEGFSTLLSSDGWKRVSWVFGPDALPMFLGKSAREVCVILGFGSVWLDTKIKNGTVFKMALFPAASVDTVLADWDGVTSVLQQHYASVWPTIKSHLARIRTTKLSEIQVEAGYDMLAVNLVGRDPETGNSADNRYMSLKCLSAIDEPTCFQVRQFLWDEIGVKELFRGDGQTVDEHNGLGPAEYFASNMPLCDIAGVFIGPLVL